jgi:hypothetical protein
MAVWRMNRRVDLPWQSTNKRSLETVMLRNVTGLLEMAVCCAKPPYEFNGFMLGNLFAFTAAYDLEGRLFAFVIAHGMVELSVIIISGAMGMQLGEALIRPGQRNRLQAFQETSINAGKILLAATPFLIFAGLIEGFISPDPRFSLLGRVIIGICSWAIFWLVMLFGLPGCRANKPPSI